MTENFTKWYEELIEWRPRNITEINLLVSYIHQETFYIEQK